MSDNCCNIPLTLSENPKLSLRVSDSSYSQQYVLPTMSSSVKGGAYLGDGLEVDIEERLGIADGGVTADKIADGAVTEDKLSDDSVTSGKIADGAVTYAKLGDSSVTADKIADGAVNFDKLDSSVTDLIGEFPTVGDGLQLANDTLSAKIGAGLQFDANNAIELASGDIDGAVSDWLDAHPEATTTVADNSITDAKLVQTGGVLSDVGDIESEIDNFTDSINLYDGKTVVYGGWTSAKPTIAGDSTQAKRIAVIPCEPNTTYYIVRSGSLSYGRIGYTTEDTVQAGTSVVHLKNNIGGVTTNNVTTGEDAKYLLFYYTYTSEEQFIQVTDYATTTLNQDTYPTLSDAVYTKSEVYSKGEVDSLISLIPVGESRKCLISKTGDKLDIYIPSKSSDNYMHYAYQLVTTASKNMNQWKVKNPSVCDSSLNVLYNLHASTEGNVEWEGVVKETGAEDFIGGYHGNETNDSLSVFVDGHEYDMMENHELATCSEVLIVNESTVNSYSDTSDALFKRYKVSTWTADKYTVRNRWIALRDDISLVTVYLTMLSLPVTIGDYSIAEHGRFDDGYIVQDRDGDAAAGSCLYPSNYAKTVEFWGDDFYGRCKAVYDSYASDYWCRCDRSQTNTFKGYWNQYSNGVTLGIGDELNGLSEFEFKF